MFTADQLVAHAVGDYILQSDWMADNKTKSHVAAAIHAVTYTLPFLLITQSPAALALICGSHFVVDRWRLARFVVWLKNGPLWIEDKPQWKVTVAPVTATGYQDSKPPFLAIWLLIIADNIIHVICNAIAIQFFG
jgi:hypothetical protein